MSAIKWYMRPGQYDDVVVSNAVRFARNLEEFDFRDRLSPEDSEKLVTKVRNLTKNISGHECTDYYSCNVNKLSELERQSLVEMHVISSELAAKKQPTGLIISEDESVSIMINEEDHIRIRAVTAGSNIRESYKLADRIDDYIDSELAYAYSDKYGYLTTCMSDVGTGMKASYLLSLPALTMSGKIKAIKDEVGKFGAVLKEMYSEDEKTAGFMYRMSNQKTLGMSEIEIIDNLEQVTGQIVALERKRRTSWIENEHDDVEDKIYRSYGVLRHTRLITCKDAMMLLAQLKLGSDTGLIALNGNGADIHRLMIEIQPSNLRKMYKCDNNENAINKVRAAYLNEKLPHLRNEQ